MTSINAGVISGQVNIGTGQSKENIQKLTRTVVTGMEKVEGTVQKSGANVSQTMTRSMASMSAATTKSIGEMQNTVSAGFNQMSADATKNTAVIGATMQSSMGKVATTVQKTNQASVAGFKALQNEMARTAAMAQTSAAATNTALASMQKSLDAGFKSLATNVKNSNAEIRKTKSVAKEAADGIDDLAENTLTLDKRLHSASIALNSMGRGLTRLGGALMSITIPMAIIGVLSIATFAKFERSLGQAGVVMNATAGQMEELEDNIARLGKSTIYTMTQVADASRELAKGGLEFDQVVGSLDATLHLAAAAGIEFERAAVIMTDILQGYSLEAGEAIRVTDEMAFAVTNASANFEEMARAVQTGVALHNLFGWSESQVIAMSAEMHNVGYKGTRAMNPWKQYGISMTRVPGIEARQERDWERSMEAANRNLASVTGRLEDAQSEVARNRAERGDWEKKRRMDLQDKEERLRMLDMEDPDSIFNMAVRKAEDRVAKAKDSLDNLQEDISQELGHYKFELDLTDAEDAVIDAQKALDAFIAMGKTKDVNLLSEQGYAQGLLLLEKEKREAIARRNELKAREKQMKARGQIRDPEEDALKKRLAETELADAQMDLDRMKKVGPEDLANEKARLQMEIADINKELQEGPEALNRALKREMEVLEEYQAAMENLRKTESERPVEFPLSIYDADGNLISDPLVWMEQINELKKSGLTLEDVYAFADDMNIARTALEIFGLVDDEYIENYKQQLKEVQEDSAGAAEKLAGPGIEGIAGSFEKIKAAVEGAMVDGVFPFRDALKELMEVRIIGWVEKLAEKFSGLSMENKTLIAQFTVFGSIVAGLLILLGRLTQGKGGIIGGLSSMVRSAQNKGERLIQKQALTAGAAGAGAAGASIGKQASKEVVEEAVEETGKRATREVVETVAMGGAGVAGTSVVRKVKSTVPRTIKDETEKSTQRRMLQTDRAKAVAQARKYRSGIAVDLRKAKEESDIIRKAKEKSAATARKAEADAVESARAKDEIHTKSTARKARKEAEAARKSREKAAANASRKVREKDVAEASRKARETAADAARKAKIDAANTARTRAAEKASSATRMKFGVLDTGDAARKTKETTTSINNRAKEEAAISARTKAAARKARKESDAAARKAREIAATAKQEAAIASRAKDAADAARKAQAEADTAAARLKAGKAASDATHTKFATYGANTATGRAKEEAAISARTKAVARKAREESDIARKARETAADAARKAKSDAAIAARAKAGEAASSATRMKFGMLDTGVVTRKPKVDDSIAARATARSRKAMVDAEPSARKARDLAAATARRAKEDADIERKAKETSTAARKARKEAEAARRARERAAAVATQKTQAATDAAARKAEKDAKLRLQKRPLADMDKTKAVADARKARREASENILKAKEAKALHKAHLEDTKGIRFRHMLRENAAMRNYLSDTSKTIHAGNVRRRAPIIQAAKDVRWDAMMRQNRVVRDFMVDTSKSVSKMPVNKLKGIPGILLKTVGLFPKLGKGLLGVNKIVPKTAKGLTGIKTALQIGKLGPLGAVLGTVLPTGGWSLAIAAVETGIRKFTDIWKDFKVSTGQVDSRSDVTPWKTIGETIASAITGRDIAGERAYNKVAETEDKKFITEKDKTEIKDLGVSQWEEARIEERIIEARKAETQALREWKMDRDNIVETLLDPEFIELLESYGIDIWDTIPAALLDEAKSGGPGAKEAAQALSDMFKGIIAETGRDVDVELPRMRKSWNDRIKGMFSALSSKENYKDALVSFNVALRKFFINTADNIGAMWHHTGTMFIRGWKQFMAAVRSVDPESAMGALKGILSGSLMLDMIDDEEVRDRVEAEIDHWVETERGGVMFTQSARALELQKLVREGIDINVLEGMSDEERLDQYKYWDENFGTSFMPKDTGKLPVNASTKEVAETVANEFVALANPAEFASSIKNSMAGFENNLNQLSRINSNALKGIISEDNAASRVALAEKLMSESNEALILVKNSLSLAENKESGLGKTELEELRSLVSSAETMVSQQSSAYASIVNTLSRETYAEDSGGLYGDESGDPYAYSAMSTEKDPMDILTETATDTVNTLYDESSAVIDTVAKGGEAANDALMEGASALNTAANHMYNPSGSIINVGTATINVGSAGMGSGMGGGIMPTSGGTQPATQSPISATSSGGKTQTTQTSEPEKDEYVFKPPHDPLAPSHKGKTVGQYESDMEMYNNPEKYNQTSDLTWFGESDEVNSLGRHRPRDPNKNYWDYWGHTFPEISFTSNENMSKFPFKSDSTAHHTWFEDVGPGAPQPREGYAKRQRDLKTWLAQYQPDYWTTSFPGATDINSTKTKPKYRGRGNQGFEDDPLWNVDNKGSMSWNDRLRSASLYYATLARMGVSTYATGTSHSNAGLSIIGETGPELVWGPTLGNLDLGSKVLDPYETMDLFNHSLGPDPVSNTSENFNESLLDKLAQRINDGRADNSRHTEIIVQGDVTDKTLNDMYDAQDFINSID